MNRVYNYILYLMALVQLFVMAACGGLINDGEGDCAPRNYLKFTYTMNTVRGDAFARQVKHLTIYTFQDDNLLGVREIQASSMMDGNMVALPENDYKPGKYHLVVRGGTSATEEDFDVTFTRSASEGSLKDMACRMRRAADNTVNYKCQPLFYGSVDLELRDEEGSHVYVVDLTKNTNDITIILQSTAENTELEKYSCCITYDNGLLDYANNMLGDDMLTFEPYESKIAEAGMTVYEQGEEKYQKMGAIVSHFRLSRLFEGTNPMFRLYVRNEDGKLEETVRVPLIDYFLLAREKYEVETNQELLDREDKYNMTFFLTGDYLSACIYINDWRYVVHGGVIMK